MSRKELSWKSDVELCVKEIERILLEYNCRIASEDYTSAWLADNDTEETAAIRNPK